MGMKRVTMMVERCWRIQKIRMVRRGQKITLSDRLGWEKHTQRAGVGNTGTTGY